MRTLVIVIVLLIWAIYAQGTGIPVVRSGGIPLTRTGIPVVRQTSVLPVSYLLYWSCNSTTIDYPGGITATLANGAALASGGPNGEYLNNGPYTTNANASFPVSSALINQGTSGKITLNFYYTSGTGSPKYIFMTNGDPYSFSALVSVGNDLTFVYGAGYIRTYLADGWHTASFYWGNGGTTYGMILDGTTTVTGTFSGSHGSGTTLLLGNNVGGYGIDKIDEVYLYAD